MAKALLVSGLGGALLLCFGFLPGAVFLGTWMSVAGSGAVLFIAPLMIAIVLASAAWIVLQQVQAITRAANDYTSHRKRVGKRAPAALAAKLLAINYAFFSPLLGIPALRMLWGASFGEAFFIV